MTFMTGCKYISVLLFTLLVACVPMSNKIQFYGWSVPAGHAINISDGGSVEGNWKTFDLDVDYVAQRTVNELVISGLASLTQHYQLLYARVNHLSLYLFLHDENGRILETVQLLFVGSDLTDRRMDFSRTVSLPEAASGLSFGYRGKVSEWDSQARFDFLPKRPN